MLGKGGKENTFHFYVQCMVILMFDCSHFKTRGRDQRSNVFERPHRIRTGCSEQRSATFPLASNRLENVDEVANAPRGQLCVFIRQFFFLDILCHFLSGSELDFHLFFGINLGSPNPQELRGKE